MREIFNTFEKYIEYYNSRKRTYDGLNLMKKETKKSLEDFVIEDLGIGPEIFEFLFQYAHDKNDKSELIVLERIRKFFI
jgi:hypothetical protein